MLVLSLFASTASALSLSLVQETTPHPGVTLRQYRTSSPTTDTWVALVDLCASGVRVDATKAPSSTRTAKSWGQAVGADLVVNGDFYKGGPLRVYGRAVGEGIPWPLRNTGEDPAYSGEWYYEKYGWIAVGHDFATYTHTEWVKNNRSVSEGWAPGEVGAAPPPGTLGLVSGFPELVIEGEQYTCSSATASSCFPDRTDMRSRHPRTAAGLTEDGSTLILAVVDGRTSRSSGMYGAELADLMHQLGAYFALNLDGGGSTQMWVRGSGYANDASGNNGGGVRSVANHLGVFADGSGRPGHCPTEPACGTIPPGGGVVDDDSACFRTFGPSEYWREESAGQGGHLYWTNAWKTDQASNWAWWQLELEAAGEYRVEVYADPAFAVFDDVPYVVVADGVEHEVRLDQGAASGWTALGTFDFAAGGGQHVAVYDAVDYSVASGQHIVADAIRLVRLDAYCGDGTCDEDCETCPEDCPPTDEIPGNGADDDCDGEVDELDDTGDTAVLDSGDTSLLDTGGGPRRIPDEGCGCRTGGGAAWVWLVALALVRRRR